MSKGKHAIIDADVHPLVEAQVPDYLEEPWRARYAGGNRGALEGGLGYWNPNGVRRSDAVLPNGTRIDSDPESTARHFFDVNDIEYGVLNVDHLGFGLSPDIDFGAAVASAVNDVIVQEWLPVDSRFRAALVVSPLDPELAAREIHRLGDHPGIVQVLMPSGARAPYGQRFYHPIYEAAVAHGLPVALHPGTEGVGVSGPPTAAGYPSNYFEWHTGLVTSYMAHLISLVTEGVFVKFPALKFVLIEGGVSWLPPLLWRLDKNWKGLRRITPWLDRLPSEIVQEHVLLTTQPIEEPKNSEHLQQMLLMFDAERMLMFSSDYPHWDGDTPNFAGRIFKPELRHRVMSETARELYCLPGADHG